MIRCLCLGFLGLLAVQAVADEPFATAPPEKDGMTVLFNGENLDGWDGDSDGVIPVGDL